MTNELRHTDCDCCEHVQGIIERLRTQLVIKDKALEPFAKIELSPDFNDVARFKLIHVPDGQWTSISAGDLRRAAQAHNTPENK